MKIECAIDKIKKAVMLSEKVTGKNLTLPVLSTILCIASGKSLKMRATNLSLGIEVEIPAKVELEGVCAIPGATLANIFSTLYENGEAKLEVKNGNLHISTKKNNFIIKGEAYEDFPTLPAVEGNSITIPAKKFIDGIRSVYYSASFSEIKPEISSVYVYPENDALVFVSTDSFRLAEKKVKIKNLTDFSPILIPFKNVGEIMRTMSEYDGDLTVTANKNQIVLRSPSVYLTSRIIDGNFPDYRQIIPKTHTTEVVALKEDVMNALKISNIFSDKFNQITISINPSAKKFNVYAKNSDVGENTTEIDAALTGEKVEANVNYKYLFECFQSISDDSVVIRATGENKPITIAGVSDQSFLYLVMPMNR
jgi:DNA polymerase-3 subunit beta